MIALVEGAERQKTPNEIALTILLVRPDDHLPDRGRSTIPGFASYAGGSIPVASWSPAVCLIPTTIGALLSAIGIAGMDRLVRFNVLAMSGRAVEAAGDVDTLLLDKTGTITSATARPASSARSAASSAEDLADAAQLASLADETPEGRSIVVLAKEKRFRDRDVPDLHASLRRLHRADPHVAASTVSRRPSIRKGAVDSILARARAAARPPGDRELQPIADEIARPAARRWRSRRTAACSASIHLKDVVKAGIRERFAELRRWASAP
jgi:potassium-transporting ATPase ATP-binding subunit